LLQPTYCCRKIDNYCSFKTMKLISLASLVTLPAILLSSCATYHMTKEELYQQIAGATPKEVVSSLSAGLVHNQYTANGVRTIKCTDKNGKSAHFENSPRVEVRITTTRNKKRMFYFDTILLQDSVFSGMNSRILGTRRSVKFSDIKKVELQEKQRSSITPTNGLGL
jgi:hypothetical protein